MKKLAFPIIAFALSLPAALPAYAKDDAVNLPVAEALASADAKEKLGESVKFYFGNQSHAKVLTKFGSDVTNQKTNAFGKSTETACNWAFLSAMLALQKRAEQLGANAVINIVSYYKKDEMKSDTEFECHKGGIIAGVALKGDFVKLSGK